MPIVAMPDGTQVSFPDEMPKEQIRDMILRKFPDAGNPAPQGDGEQPSPAFQDALAKIRAGAPGAADPRVAAAGMPTIDQNAPGSDGQFPQMNMAGNAKGLLTPGNIDLAARPVVKNADGSISTVRSMSFGEDGREVLVPTVSPDGRVLSDDEAIDLYRRTGQHLGMFDNPDDATAYAESLHGQQEQMYAGGQKPANPGAELGLLTTGFQNAPQEDTDRLVRANLEASKIQEMQGDKGLLRRAAEAIPGGATGGFADEVYSGTVGAGARMLRDGVGYGEAYKREQALAAAQKRKRGDAANIIGDVAGGLATGGTLAKGGLTLTGRATSGLGKVAAAAGEGAAYGGVYGAGNAEEGKRLEDAGYGALTGAVTGGLLEGAGNVASRALSPKGPATQTAADLAQEGRALYDQASSAGVTVRPQAINNAAGNVTMKLKSFGFDKDLQPKTAVVAKKLLEARNKTLDLSELDNIRKMASGISREQSAASSDRAAAGLIVDEIDKIIDNTANFSAGSGQALSALKQGREVWKRKMKTETLEDLVEKAQNQATGFENGLVIQLRALANNKTKMRAFSKPEQKMIKSVVRRGSAHGVLRALGMLSPGSTFGGLVTGGTAVGSGILPGAALAATGAAAKAGAGALTRGKVNTLQRAVSTGQLPMLALPNYLRPAIGGATAGTVEMRPQGLLGN